MRLNLPAAAAALLFCCAPAMAQDRAPCGKDLVCASDPNTVLAAMAAADLKPKLSKDNDGDPMIEVEDAPYHFDVFFYGCEKARNCDSLRFEVSFNKEPGATSDLANKWNAGHRFITAAVKSDGRFVLSYDVAMIGGATKRNFADTLDWWVSMLSDSAEFFRKELNVTD